MSIAQVDSKVAPRDRIVNVAYELFSQRGIRAVGIDEIIATSGVAKATLYKHFGSKDELVRTFLRRREQVWTFDKVEFEATRRGSTPRERLLAIFDVFDEWFHTPEYEGCSFINVLLEMGSEHPLGQASITHLENIRTLVERLAREAGLTDPPNFAWSWHILMKGSIISAAEGDLQAARRAQAMARSLIDTHSETPTPNGVRSRQPIRSRS